MIVHISEQIYYSCLTLQTHCSFWELTSSQLVQALSLCDIETNAIFGVSMPWTQNLRLNFFTSSFGSIKTLESAGIWGRNELWSTTRVGEQEHERLDDWIVRKVWQRSWDFCDFPDREFTNNVIKTKSLYCYEMKSSRWITKGRTPARKKSKIESSFWLVYLVIWYRTDFFSLQ